MENSTRYIEKFFPKNHWLRFFLFIEYCQVRLHKCQPHQKKVLYQKTLCQRALQDIFIFVKRKLEEGACESQLKPISIIKNWREFQQIRSTCLTETDPETIRAIQTVALIINSFFEEPSIIFNKALLYIEISSLITSIPYDLLNRAEEVKNQYLMCGDRLLHLISNSEPLCDSTQEKVREIQHLFKDP